MQWALLLVAVALTVVSPRLARAETCPNVNLSVDSMVGRYVGRSDTAANAYPLRPQIQEPTWIDHQDCADDIRLQFTLLASGLPCADTIQVWAGTTDCTQVSARQPNSGATRCWPVTPAGSFAMSATSTADIRAADIVAFIESAALPTAYHPSGVASCQSLVDAARAAPCGTGLSLYFMAIEADGETVDGTSAVYRLGAANVPPDAASCGPPSVDGGLLDGDGGFAYGPGGPPSGCWMAPGQGSGIGILSIVGFAALGIGRRRRRAADE